MFRATAASKMNGRSMCSIVEMLIFCQQQRTSQTKEIGQTNVTAQCILQTYCSAEETATPSTCFDRLLALAEGKPVLKRSQYVSLPCSLLENENGGPCMKVVTHPTHTWIYQLGSRTAGQAQGHVSLEKRTLSGSQAAPCHHNGGARICGSSLGGTCQLLGLCRLYSCVANTFGILHSGPNKVPPWLQAQRSAIKWQPCAKIGFREYLPRWGRV